WLYRVLEEEISPLFYSNGQGPTAMWISKMRRAWTSLGPYVTAGRMVAEYDERLYRPDGAP
ncbi:MAG: hypothetical protein M3094_00655, partial [Actinomycetia bacterium]|nr:hypothetical protein [Actinomycetes bacterium]